MAAIIRPRTLQSVRGQEPRGKVAVNVCLQPRPCLASFRRDSYEMAPGAASVVLASLCERKQSLRRHSLSDPRSRSNRARSEVDRHQGQKHDGDCEHNSG
jgi:hypothetical protein